MKKILIMSEGDPTRDPRPNRFIQHFSQNNSVHVLSDYPVVMPGVVSYSFKQYLSTDNKIKNKKNKRINIEFIIKPVRLALGIMKVWWFIFCYFIGSLSFLYPEKTLLVRKVAKNDYDLIISHDLTLLPLAFEIKAQKTRIILDAREYHPLNYQDQWFWRLEKKPFLLMLCRKYLHQCDMILTVSRGIADTYHQRWGVRPEVFMSLPDSFAIIPQMPKGKIHLIHHGWPSRSRQIELMIYMMDYVDERFSLDLMLLPGTDSYWDQLVNLVSTRKNVRIIPPVKMQDIIPTIKKYDIGVFIVPPVNLNLKYSLPNKLFEFIQARLAVAIGPSPEMQEIVKKFHCGLISEDFSPKTMAELLNRQTNESIFLLKMNADIAANELNNGKSFNALESLLKDLWKPDMRT
ncbi:glycosyltransferase [Methanospirillum sp.]|uniref:glycosyltransferase n=1 Tax=Methanospirillum sp. TaxID=45200 RepID=UPI0035A0CA14